MYVSNGNAGFSVFVHCLFQHTLFASWTSNSNGIQIHSTYSILLGCIQLITVQYFNIDWTASFLERVSSYVANHMTALLLTTVVSSIQHIFCSGTHIVYVSQYEFITKLSHQYVCTFIKQKTEQRYTLYSYMYITIMCMEI